MCPVLLYWRVGLALATGVWGWPLLGWEKNRRHWLEWPSGGGWSRLGRPVGNESPKFAQTCFSGRKAGDGPKFAEIFSQRRGHPNFKKNLSKLWPGPSPSWSPSKRVLRERTPYEYPSQAPLSLVLVQYELHNRFTFTLPTRVIHIPPRARAAPLVLAGGRCGGERRGRRCGVESRATAALRLVRPAPGV